MTPTEDELRRWREVASKATPGEWLRRNATSVGTINGYLMFCEFPRDAEHASTFNPLTITRLIDAVEYLQKWNEQLGDMHKHHSSDIAILDATNERLRHERDVLVQGAQDTCMAALDENDELRAEVETLKKENERLKAEIEEWQLAIKATAPK